MLEVIGSLFVVIAVAALILRSIELLAKLVGNRTTTMLLLGVLPVLAGAAIVYVNRANLRWWEVVAYPLAAPLVLLGVIFLGYVAVSPFGIPDLLTLACNAIKSGWRILCRCARRRQKV